MRLIDADALCRTISLHIMAYKTLLNNKITIPNQIDKEKVNSVIDGFRECIDIVYHEPRVIAEPIRHGHWEFYAKSIKDVPTESCSECGGWSYGDNEAYCPCCGAKMEEIKDEVD